MSYPKTVSFSVVKKALKLVEGHPSLERFLECYLNSEDKPDPKVCRLVLQMSIEPAGWGPPGGYGHLAALKVMLEFYDPKHREPGDDPSTAFTWACSHGRTRVARFLVKNVAFKIPQDDYEICLRHAKDRDHRSIVKLLESNEAVARIHSDPNWD